ncbi:hypothetical protein [uncultured Shimia sp.]|uniref:hypothetical protein n=1 Tax=uncultured Shimia sp. TaxID=573152 RepID=UPI002614FE38|nr:hypothetical protein [uncultured Shimia sp.]
MLILGILILFVPPVVTALTAYFGYVMLKTRRLIGSALMGLAVYMGLIMLWEFQYDIGIDLPDLDWIPPGLSGDATLLAVAGLMALGLILAVIKWPEGQRFRWLAIVTALLWGAVCFAGLVLSQVNFMH